MELTTTSVGLKTISNNVHNSKCDNICFYQVRFSSRVLEEPLFYFHRKCYLSLSITSWLGNNNIHNLVFFVCIWRLFIFMKALNTLNNAFPRLKSILCMQQPQVNGEEKIKEKSNFIVYIEFNVFIIFCNVLVFLYTYLFVQI